MRFHLEYGSPRFKTAVIAVLVLLVVWFFGIKQDARQEDVRLYLSQGDAYLRRGCWREAQTSFDKALRADNDSARTYLAVAVIWSRCGTFLQSLRAAETAVAASRRQNDKESQYQALLLIAEINLYADRTPAAAAAYERALKLRPKDAGLMNNLACQYAVAGIKFDKAENLARRAVRAQPWNADFIDTLGWAHFKAKRYDEARRELQKAAWLKPDEAVIRQHLGAALLSLGQKRAAHIEFKKASFLKRYWR